MLASDKNEKTGAGEGADFSSRLINETVDWAKRHSELSVAIGFGVIASIASLKKGRVSPAVKGAVEEIASDAETLALSEKPLVSGGEKILSKPPFPGGKVDAEKAIPPVSFPFSATAETHLEIPELWVPKRTFSSREELFEEAGFPGMEKMELVHQPLVNKMVGNLREPISGWSEDLVSRGEFQRSYNYMMMRRIQGAPVDNSLADVMTARAADIDRALGRFTTENKLPYVPVVRNGSDMIGMLGALHMGKGKILIPDASLMVATDAKYAHEFVGVASHEYNHGLQMNLILRKLTQDLNVSPGSGAEISRVAEEYEKRFGGAIEHNVIADLLKANQPKLSASESARAEALIAGWGGNRSSVGSSFEFSTVKQNLEDMMGIDANPVSFTRSFLRCLQDPHFAEGNLGSGELSPSLKWLRQEIVDNGRDDLVPRAVEELRPIVIRRLQEINSLRQNEYAAYMQLHEQESLVVGELARLRSTELGPIIAK